MDARNALARHFLAALAYRARRAPENYMLADVSAENLGEDQPPPAPGRPLD